MTCKKVHHVEVFVFFGYVEGRVSITIFGVDFYGGRFEEKLHNCYMASVRSLIEKSISLVVGFVDVDFGHRQ